LLICANAILYLHQSRASFLLELYVNEIYAYASFDWRANINDIIIEREIDTQVQLCIYEVVFFFFLLLIVDYNN